MNAGIIAAKHSSKQHKIVNRVKKCLNCVLPNTHALKLCNNMYGFIKYKIQL